MLVRDLFQRRLPLWAFAELCLKPLDHLIELWRTPLCWLVGCKQVIYRFADGIGLPSDPRRLYTPYRGDLNTVRKSQHVGPKVVLNRKHEPSIFLILVLGYRKDCASNSDKR